MSPGSLVPLEGAAAATELMGILSGNINQYLEGINAFGLDSDQARLVRLFFQPLLVVWALWSASTVSYLKNLRARKRQSSEADTV